MDSPVVTTMEGTSPWSSKAQRAWRIFRDYDAQRSKWAKMAAEDEDFFAGRQWTAQEIRQLRARGMAPLVVNRTHPVIMQEVSIVCAKRPAFRYIGRDDNDVDLAAMWSDVAAWIWDMSSGDVQYQSSVKDMFVMGPGYLQAYIDAYGDDGNGEVRFRALSPFDVYPDPNSREIDLSDARAIIVSRVIDKDQLVMMYPDKRGLIRRAMPEHGPIEDRPGVNPWYRDGGILASDYDYIGTSMQQEKTRVVELYEKLQVPFWRVINPATGASELIPQEAMGRDSIPEGYEVMKIWKPRIRLTVTAGENVVLFEGMMPTGIYPIIPMFLHHKKNPYPSGDVALIKGMQREINKRRSIMIHNATLTGNYRILAETGSIANEEEFKLHGTQPGFILKYRPTVTGQPPRELLPQALPNAWIQLENEAKGDLEYTLSVFAHMMGDSRDAPETFRGLLALEEAGQQKIRHKTQHASNALKTLGRVLFDFARYVYTEPKLLRIVGEDNEDYRGLFLNGTVEDPETGEVRRINDTQVGEFDLVVVDGSVMPTNRQALLSAYMELYQLGIIDREEVLKKTDVVNRRQVLERMSEIAELSAQLGQASDTIKNLEGLNQTMRRQLQQSEVNIDIQKGGEEIREQVSQTRMTQELTRQRMKDELGLMKKKSELVLRESKLTAAAFAAKSKVQVFLDQELAKIENKKKEA